MLDEVKRGNGRVVPSRQIQVVQSLEGGIVDGDPGAGRRDRARGRAADADRRYQLRRAIRRDPRAPRRHGRAGRAARSRGTGAKPVFPDELCAPRRKAVETETQRVRGARAKARAGNRRAHRSRRPTADRDRWQLLDREVDADAQALRTRRWCRRSRCCGSTARQRDARAARRKRKSKHRRSVTLAPSARRRRTISPSRKGDLAVLDENIKSAQDRVRRTELRSPVNGIVNKLNVTTVGAVVPPGGNVMDIVPLDDTLLVEGRIRPQDIAFIRPDQDAVVKISAYDSSVYGSLKGKVERISADTIAEEAKGQAEKETFYRVMVRTDTNHLGTAERSAADHSRHGGDGGGPDRPEDRARLSAQAGADAARRGAARKVRGSFKFERSRQRLNYQRSMNQAHLAPGLTGFLALTP